MAENRLTIDTRSTFDNVGERQVEFRGEVDGEVYGFAVQYAVLEALSGAVIDARPMEAFTAVQEEVARAGLIALARADGNDLVVIGEHDLDQTASTAPGPHAGPEPDGFYADGTGSSSGG